MKGMILAAGFGTRLQPLTDTLPKALIEHKSNPMIVNTIEYLKKFGVNEIVINTHHHADKMIEFFDSYNPECEVHLVHETEILGTGGGILNAAAFLADEDFFIVMNTDIETDFDLSDAFKEHITLKPFATLVVQDRHTSRKLSFDKEMNLFGRAKENDRNTYAFNGIHIVSNDIFNLGLKVEFIDIIEIYLNAVIEGNNVKGFKAGNSFFTDLGKIENLKSLN